MATNVKPKDLNYDRYETEKYDEDIVRSIPGHEELHRKIDEIITQKISAKKLRILELGIGTGLTALRILKKIQAHYSGVDFSKTMLDGARRKLAGYDVEFILGDFAQIKFPKENDIIISVIGIHHQKTDNDKEKLFERIYLSLKKEGIFIFGDLITYRNKEEAALNDALHYHYLVEHAKDQQSLKEWAHHHKFLNKLAPLEDQVDWLKKVGFRKVEVVFQKFNTALVYAQK